MKTFAFLALLAVAAYAEVTSAPEVLGEAIVKRQVGEPPVEVPLPAPEEPTVDTEETKRDKRQVEDPKEEVKPVEEPAVIVKRQIETEEVKPDVEIEILDGKPTEERKKRETDDDEDDINSTDDVEGPIETVDETNADDVIIQPVQPFQHTIVKREIVEPPVETLPEPDVNTDETKRDKRQIEDPKEEVKEKEPVIVKRQIEDSKEEVKPDLELEILDGKPTAERTKRDTEPETADVDDQTDNTESDDTVDTIARGKRQTETETPDEDNETFVEVDDPKFQLNRQKRQVEGQVNETRTKRFAEEHGYPDCSCLRKYPHLPLYTKLHAHCSYPGKPHRPHPPCNSCGHHHEPRAPCRGHGHGHGPVYHHHHVHVVPQPVQHVHHDVHHHFVPKRPHYRAPCDRSHHHDHFDEELHY